MFIWSVYINTEMVAKGQGHTVDIIKIVYQKNILIIVMFGELPSVCCMY